MYVTHPSAKYFETAKVQQTILFFIRKVLSHFYTSMSNCASSSLVVTAGDSSFTVCNFCSWFELDFESGELCDGTVTPGMRGRLAGGVLARGDCRICIRKALS